MENTREEEFPLPVLLVLFFVFFDLNPRKNPIREKLQHLKKRSSFHLPHAIPTRHTLFRLQKTPMNVRFPPEIGLCLA